MEKFTRSHYSCSYTMSMLVDIYRKAVTSHATIAKREKAYQQAREFYFNMRELRKEMAELDKKGEEYWEPFLI